MFFGLFEQVHSAANACHPELAKDLKENAEDGSHRRHSDLSVEILHFAMLRSG